MCRCSDVSRKELGKGQAFIYEPGLYESMTQQVSMVNDLRRTVENHLLDFYIQGKYDLNGELKGARYCAGGYRGCTAWFHQPYSSP